ncbi:MAG: hypothetical protein FWG68_03780 [Defluviitaleaceae bacterium]|nr:hypothetical protein [Defluviitaleaceae bacterium]
MHINRTVAIISIAGGCANELHSILEYYGYLTVMHHIGRPQHFIELLQGKMLTKFDFIIIDCHGEDGKIIMPELAADIYFPNEPRGNFGATEISKYLSWEDTCVIINGCSTGTAKWQKFLLAKIISFLHLTII